MRRVAAALFALSLPLLAACGSDDSPTGEESPSSTAEFTEKNLDTAVAAMQEYSDRYTSGDYEGAYDLSATETRDAYSVEEFTRIQEACYQGGGMPIDVEGVRVDGDEATVRLVVGEFKESRKALYQEGGWKSAPTKDTDLSLTAGEQVEKCEQENGGESS